MVANTPFVAPKAPFVIVTRKGGFPAATVVEAQRVVRPLVADDRTSVTDASGRKYTAREFLTAVQHADDVRAATPAARPAMPSDLKDWASATADIDLGGEAPPGWSPPPTPSLGTPTVTTASRSSGRMPSPGARSRPTSDRRPSGGRRREETSSTTLVMIVGIVVLAAGIAAMVWWQRVPAPAPVFAPPVSVPTESPQPPPATAPAHPTLTPDGRVRPEDRPLPTYMR